MSAGLEDLERGKEKAVKETEKCECVGGSVCCEKVGCGEKIKPVRRRLRIAGVPDDGKPQLDSFMWTEENGGEDGDLDHRLCRECVESK